MSTTSRKQGDLAVDLRFGKPGARQHQPKVGLPCRIGSGPQERSRPAGKVDPALTMPEGTDQFTHRRQRVLSSDDAIPGGHQLIGCQ